MTKTGTGAKGEASPTGESSSKARMILATLDLLRGSGLGGAGINQIVESSGAPKGSVYHFFPSGKHGLVAAALREAEQAVGQGFRTIFGGPAPLPDKVRTLFGATAARLRASSFRRGCPVAAVTLDLDGGAEDLREVCRRVFASWRDIIAAGLREVPKPQRRVVAQLILATLEGALILARAQARPDPLEQTGALLARTLTLSMASPSVGKRRRGGARHD